MNHLEPTPATTATPAPEPDPPSLRGTVIDWQVIPPSPDCLSPICTLSQGREVAWNTDMREARCLSAWLSPDQAPLGER
jgi:hypothetical protein